MWRLQRGPCIAEAATILEAATTELRNRRARTSTISSPSNTAKYILDRTVRPWLLFCFGTLESVQLWNFKVGGSQKVRFLAKNQHATKDFFLKFLRVMPVCQKLGVILERKVVQKLSLEKKNNGLLD